MYNPRSAVDNNGSPWRDVSQRLPRVSRQAYLRGEEGAWSKMKKNFFVVLKIAISHRHTLFPLQGDGSKCLFRDHIQDQADLNSIAVIVLIFSIQCISSLRWQILLEERFRRPLF